MTTTHLAKKTGRKRLLLAGGALLGVGALFTAAGYVDFGLLDLGGTGGFGGSENVYNLQFSDGQEATIAAVTDWKEANPDAEDVAPIAGADALFPGGDPVLVNLPVQNASPTFDSTLTVTFENITPVDNDAAQQARNEAYADLLRIDVAQVDDASTAPVTWVSTDLAFDAQGNTATVDLADLAATSGTITVARVYLVQGATQDDSNAANGGTVQVQARFDGESQ